MAHGQFVVSDNNPNNTTGGGGCICDPRSQVDCKPPYVVCYGNEMDDGRSPHVVVCKTCVEMFSKAFEGEINSVGAKSPAPTKVMKKPGVQVENEFLPNTGDEEQPI